MAVMRPGTKWLLWTSLTLSTACGVELGVPNGAAIACSGDDDCPGSTRCDTRAGLCVAAGETLTAPALAISSVTVGLSQVSVDVVVSDAEADDVTFDVVLLSDGGERRAVTVSPQGVAASVSGSSAQLVWDAEAFFGSRGSQPDLRLEITPWDYALRGQPQTTESFRFGNDAPSIELLTVSDDSTPFAGLVTLELRVADDTDDPLAFESLTLLTDAETDIPIDNQNFPSLDGFSLTPGAVRTLVWQSARVANFYASGARLRAVVRDADGALSAPLLSAAFEIDNRSIVSLDRTDPNTRAVAAAQFTVTVSDPNVSNAVDVHLEYSTDGVSWSEATLSSGDHPGTGLHSGDVVTMTWDLLADAANADLPLSSDGLHPAFVSGGKVRAVAMGQGVASPSPAITMDFGNDPPVVQDLRLVDDPVSGLATVVLRVFDSSADPVQLDTVTVTPDGGSEVNVTIDAGNFPGLGALSLQGDDLEQPIVWDSRIAAGFVDSATALTLRVRDDVGAVSDTFTSAGFAVDNGPTLILDGLTGSSSDRPVSSLTTTLTVSHPDPTVTVGYRVEYEVVSAAGPVTLATLGAPSSANPQTGFSPGAPLQFRWDMASDADRGGLTGSGGSIDYVPALRVIVTPEDSNGNTGAAAYLTYNGSEPFAAGNNPPVVSLSASTGSVSGDVPIQLSIADNASDIGSVEVQFQLDGETTWRAAKLSSGNPTQLPTSPAGNDYVVVWQSLTAPDAVETAPQGIGSQWLRNIRVRARAADRVQGATQDGPWSNVIVLSDVRNQTPTSIFDLIASADRGGDGTGPVILRYRLVDAQSDAADLYAEFSVDGVNYAPIPEYPVPESSGLRDLATAPDNASGTGGVSHQLFLDPAGLIVDAKGAPRVRLTVTDGYPVGAPRQSSAEVIIAAPVGEVGLPPDNGLTPSSTLYPAVGQTYDVALCDIDQDGNLDVVATEASSSGFVAYLGDGQGGFGLRTPYSGYSGAPGTNGILCVDLSDDGYPDVVVSNADAMALFINSATGDGSFERSSSLGSFGPCYGLAATELSGDGLPDVVVACGLYILAYINDTTLPGRFNGVARLRVNDVRAVDVGDFNGDTRNDVVAADQGTGKVLLLLGRTYDNLARDLLANPYAAATTSAPGINILTTDFDGDAQLDAVVSLNGAPPIALLNDGDAVSPMFAPTAIVGVEEVADLLMVDFNGDGIEDLAAVGPVASGPDQLYALTRDASGNFTLAYQFPVPNTPTAIAAGDFGGIGPMGFAVSALVDVPGEYGITAISLPTTTRDENFESEPVIGVPYASAYDGIVAADVDDDGDIDFIGASDHLDLWRSQGVRGVGGAHFALEELANPVVPGDLHWGDCTGDGMPDLVHHAASLDEIHLYPAGSVGGAADGSFAAPIVTSGIVADHIAQLVDLDRDGNLDLVLAQTPSKRVTVVFGNGDGTFGPDTFSSATSGGASTSGSTDVVVADFNEDGFLDMVVGNDYLYADLFFGGAPSGAERVAMARSTFASGMRTHWLVADHNDDGILDLIGLTTLDYPRAPPAVVPFFGNGTAGVGDGAFAYPVVFPATRAASDGGILRDVDGDGILDLRPTVSGTPLMYFGKADGGAPTGDFDTSTLPVHDLGSQVVSADLNRDGLGDIIGTNSYLGISHGESFEQFPTTLLPAMVYSQSPGIEPWSGRFGGSLEPVTTLSVEIDRLGRGGEGIGRMDEYAAIERDLVTPKSLVPLSAYWRVYGHQRLDVISAAGVEALTGDAASSDRLRVIERFGDRVDPTSPTNLQRQGLDGAAGRGVYFELPVLAQRSDAEIAAAVDFKLYVLVSDFERAASWPADPLFGNPAAADLLPQIADASSPSGYRDVLRRSERWVEVPHDGNDDLSDGSGARFAVVGRTIQVFAENTGVFRAFIQASAL